MIENQIFYNREEKLHYILKKLNISTKDIAERLEISTGLVSQIQHFYYGKLRKIHLYAISNAYNIPIEIFEEESINSTELIDKLLKQSVAKEMFKPNHQLLDKLLGKWYLYSYPSNLNISDVWSTETHIYEDSTVFDKHKNKGFLHIGEKQSVILKESHNSKNVTTTVFDNDRVTYENFPFSRIAKSNNFNREILSFGFFSRRDIAKSEAKEILGEIKKVQLQMDYSVIERISGLIEING